MPLYERWAGLYVHFISYISLISSNVLLLFVEYWTPKKNRKSNDKYFIYWHALRHCWRYDIFFPVRFSVVVPLKTASASKKLLCMISWRFLRCELITSLQIRRSNWYIYPKQISRFCNSMLWKPLGIIVDRISYQNDKWVLFGYVKPMLLPSVS